MEESPHKCPVCNRSFNQRSNLKTHLLTHTDIKPYNCSSCGKVFRRNCDLRRHSLTHNLATGTHSVAENNNESLTNNILLDEHSSSGSNMTNDSKTTKLPSIGATIMSIKANSNKRALEHN